MKYARSWAVMLVLAACGSSGGPPRTGDPPPVGDPPEAASIAITSVPEASSVVVDGEARGNAPLTITVAPGEHRIDVSAPGFASSSQTVQAGAGEVATIEVALQPATFGMPNGVGTPPPAQPNVVQLEE